MLTRWDPFREMFALQRSMDRLFERAINNESVWAAPVIWDLALDVAENKDEFVIKASLPGMNPDDIEVTFTDNVLTIKGEVKEDKDVKEEQYHLRERRYGSFTRSIELPNKVKSDTIQASYDAGVLTLKLPKTEEVKPKKIAVQIPHLLEGKIKK
jgi:HSP20 family protein